MTKCHKQFMVHSDQLFIRRHEDHLTELTHALHYLSYHSERTTTLDVDENHEKEFFLIPLTKIFAVSMNPLSSHVVPKS